MKTFDIYSVYSKEGNMTFVMEDVFEDGEHISTECKGFYFGEPNEDYTIAHYGHLKAEF